jgi:hypothetical protein
MFSFESQKYGPLTLHEAKNRFYLIRQDNKHTSCQQYLESSRNTVEAIGHSSGGDIDIYARIVNKVIRQAGQDPGKRSDQESAEAESYARERYLACAFIAGADRQRYGKLIEDLENDHTQKQDRYPKNLVDAYGLLLNWKQNPQNLMGVIGTNSDGVAFSQEGIETGTTLANVDGGRTPSGKFWPGITCYQCRKEGHYSNEVQPAGQTGIQLLMAGVENGAFEDSSSYL